MFVFFQHSGQVASRNNLCASNGIHRVSAMAAASGLYRRQFEGVSSLIGVPTETLHSITRFTPPGSQAPMPGRAWTQSPKKRSRFYDQGIWSTLRSLHGRVPSRFLAHIAGVPEFHTFFALQTVRHQRKGALGVSVLLSSYAVIHLRSWTDAHGSDHIPMKELRRVRHTLVSAAVQASHLQPKEN